MITTPGVEHLEPAATQVQLALLRELASLLAQARLRWWLRGGWAVDFLVGRITRIHSDIDLVTWKRHATRLHHTLGEAGFHRERDLGMQMDFVKCGQTVSVVYIARTATGQIAVPEIPTWVWLPDVLALPPYQLGGITSRVLSPQQLLADQEGYQAWSNLPPRPKDVQSMVLLRQLVHESDLRRART